MPLGFLAATRPDGLVNSYRYGNLLLAADGAAPLGLSGPATANTCSIRHAAVPPRGARSAGKWAPTPPSRIPPWKRRRVGTVIPVMLERHTASQNRPSRRYLYASRHCAVSVVS
jgi:hypothetical protein